MTWEELFEEIKKMNFDPDELYEFLQAAHKLRYGREDDE